MKFYKFSFFLLLLILACCKKDDTNHAPEADFTITDKIDRFELETNTVDGDGDVLTFQWTSSSDSIKILYPNNSSSYFYLPELASPLPIQIKLVINDGRFSDSLVKDITLPYSTQVRKYGLGRVLQSEHSNNRDYEWYFDQMNSGKYSGSNDWPAVAAMAVKWTNADYLVSPEHARNTYHSDGSGWWTTDITNYLNVFSVNNLVIKLTTINFVKDQLDIGSIVILIVDMYYIRMQEKGKWHVDRFYTPSSKGYGRAIIVKGYKIIDNELFFEVYDPRSWGSTYEDGTLKGKDRYYRAGDLNEAMMRYWQYAIIVFAIE